jgi:hypothetical protein
MRKSKTPDPDEKMAFKCKPFKYQGPVTIVTVKNPSEGNPALEHAKLAEMQAEKFQTAAAFWQDEIKDLMHQKQQALLALAGSRAKVRAREREAMCAGDAEQLQAKLKKLRFELSKTEQELVRFKEIGRSVGAIKLLREKSRRIQDNMGRCDVEFISCLALSIAKSEEVEKKSELAQLNQRIQVARERRGRASDWQQFWDRVPFDLALRTQMLISFGSFDSFAHESVVELAKIDARAAEAIYGKAEVYVDELINLAKIGVARAARGVARLAISCSETANLLAEKAPTLVAPVAKSSLYWPILKSKRTSTRPEERKLVNAIELGISHPRQEDLNSRTKLEDPRGRWANQLLEYIHERRQEIHSLKRDADMDYAFSERDERIGQLRDFSQESSIKKQWWNVAREILDEAYPDLSMAAESAGVVAPGHQKRKGGKSRVLYEIERRFLNSRY